MIEDSDRTEQGNQVLSWGLRGTVGATIAGRLTFDQVSLAYGSYKAVRSVSCDLAPGEIACLLGPSGCGKTSLLRLAAGLERPQEGAVLIDGQIVAAPNHFVLPEKRGIGLVFQDFALFPHLTILDNVAFGLARLPRAEALKIATKALERVGLACYGQSYPHALSGGEQQRVALARALAPRPRVILMDEPFSGLDQRLREQVRRETLGLLREARATCLLVTHDSVEAMELADRIFLMRAGCFVQTGKPQQIYEQPVDAAAARFFSDVSEVSGFVKQGHQIDTPLGRFVAPHLKEGAAALVLIRPQGIMLTSDPQEGIEGYIADTRFIGDHFDVQVLFKGIDEALSVRLDTACAPVKGTTAFFQVSRKHVHIFERSAQYNHSALS